MGNQAANNQEPLFTISLDLQGKDTRISLGCIFSISIVVTSFVTFFILAIITLVIPGLSKIPLIPTLIILCFTNTISLVFLYSSIKKGVKNSYIAFYNNYVFEHKEIYLIPFAKPKIEELSILYSQITNIEIENEKVFTIYSHYPSKITIFSSNANQVYNWIIGVLSQNKTFYSVIDQTQHLLSYSYSLPNGYFFQKDMSSQEWTAKVRSGGAGRIYDIYNTNSTHPVAYIKFPINMNVGIDFFLYSIKDNNLLYWGNFHQQSSLHIGLTHKVQTYSIYFGNGMCLALGKMNSTQFIIGKEDYEIQLGTDLITYRGKDLALKEAGEIKINNIPRYRIITNNILSEIKATSSTSPIPFRLFSVLVMGITAQKEMKSDENKH
ncbi:hypothetical protein GF362_02780 [Candidatus Dojkabacteria bacterium]|nr:hypothetical protein [Candidatus Dojkabacteria bacterium]